MDKCKRCGQKKGFLTGLMSDYCDSCERQMIEEKKTDQRKIQHEKNAEQARIQQDKLELFNKYKASIAKDKVQVLRSRIDNGEVFFLYGSIYLPVDSVVVEEKVTSEFSVETLQILGLSGWEVTGVVPRTIGLGLQNDSYGSSMGTTWGAGVGGNVVGVHVLLKKEVSSARMVSDDFLERYVNDNIDLFIMGDEKQFLLGILDGSIAPAPELSQGIQVEGNSEPTQ
jgi:hypothetical protein